MKAITVFKLILSLIIGAGLAYFWYYLRPGDQPEIVYGVGIVGALASFVSLYFMGKSG